MITRTQETWKTRVEGPLVFSYPPDSFAEQNLEAIVEDYHKTLTSLSAFLGVAESSLPQITVHLCEVVPSGNGRDSADHAVRNPDSAEIWTTVNSESPTGSPEVELARLLLEKVYGPVTPDSRFWYDGLAGYLAGQSGSAFFAEAPTRVQTLFNGGQLPQLTDLLALYAIRQSVAGTAIATAFVGFLIDRNGLERYKRFLAGIRDGSAPAFRRAYGAPIQSLEQSWYRVLEAKSAGGGANMLDAVKQLLPYIRAYKARIVGIFVCILITISFSAFMPQAIRFLVNSILGRRPLPFALPGLAPAGHTLAVGGEQTHALLLLLGAMIFMFVLSAISNNVRAYLVTAMGEAVNYDLRMRFYSHLQRLPVGFHRATPNQDITQRFWTDIQTVSAALTAGLVPMAQSVLAMLVFSTVLISLNWMLALIALAGLPIFAFSFQRMRARLREAVLERSRRTADISQSLTETLVSPEKVRLYGLIEYLTARFVNRMTLARDHVIRLTQMATASTSTSALITNGAQVAILIVGGKLAIDGQLFQGDLMAFYVMLLQLYNPAGMFTSSMQYVNQATTSIDRVNDIFNRKIDEDAPDAVEIGPLREALRFESVSYGRTKGKDLIKDLIVEIKAGTKVAFVGPPGAGKASLMEILPRLDTIASGAVTWDGVDLDKATAASLRKQLTVVSQETYVFKATVYDNLRYGRTDATDDEIVAAAKAVGLHDYILALPAGYDTQVGDRDVSFGLVQRQRLMVARALLRDASVILMDDALSALDTPGQQELENVLRASASGGADPGQPKTVIRVAQRIGSVLDADCIFVMDGGQIVEQGTHEQLSGADGLYTQLLKDELGAGAVSGAFQAVRRLSKQAPFSSLPPEVLEEVARLMLYAERAPGDYVVRQGAVGDELFVLGRGEVEVVYEDEEGQERILGFLNEGEYFGEISFLRRIPRTASVRARTPVELHILRRQDFDQLLENLPDEITAQLDRTAQERLDATRAKLVAAEATPA